MTSPGVPDALTWWGREGLGVSVWDAALERVRHVYAVSDHVWVSFSGGKDSTVVLNVALAVARDLGRTPVRVVFFDEECTSYQTEDYVRRVAALPDVDMEWLCLPVQHRNACSMEHPHWWPWASEAADLWVRPLPPEAVTTMDGFVADPPAGRLTIPQTSERLVSRPDRDGATAILMGIRADESMMRRRAVGNHRHENYMIPAAGHPGVTKCYPIYDWSTPDVWTAPKVFGWDRNETYDYLAMHGIPPHNQRCAPPFGEQPIRDLHMWAACFPELWDRMCVRVPGAAAAARYSNTELYARGTVKVEKPADVTWREFVHDLVAGHQDPGTRRLVARKVQNTINRHYRKTSDRLAATVPHPVTGLSWQAIATLAVRGDLKNRDMIGQVKGAGFAVDPDAWAAYRADLAAAQQSGDL